MITQTAGGQPGRDRPPGLRHLPALGVETVAVHSDADADAPFVGRGRPGGTPAREHARRDVPADRPDPGRGPPHRRGRRPPRATASSPRTPSSRAAVTDAGLTWVGPPAKAIAAMGDQAGGEGAARRGGRADAAHLDRRRRDHRLPGAGQGVRRGRRAGHADRPRLPPSWPRPSPPRAARRPPRSATARSSSSGTSSAAGTSRCRSSATPTARCWLSASGTARSSAGTRRSSRRPRAVAARRGAASGCTRRRWPPAGRSTTSARARWSSCSPRAVSSSSWR